MKVNLPVPYEFKVRLLKSRAGRSEDDMACSVEEFEIPSFSSADVHLVAEWRQSWRRDGRVRKDGDILPSSGDWAADFRTNASLARLALIDGKFYSPLRYTAALTARPLLIEDLADVFAKDPKTHTVMGDCLHPLFYGKYRRALKDIGFKSLAAPITPDLRFREIIENHHEDARIAMLRWLQSVAVVDGVVFTQIAEPCIAVDVRADKKTIYIDEGRDSASEATTFFSLSDYEAAVDFYDNVTPGKSEVLRRVADVRVYVPHVLTNKIEETELLRSVRQLIEDVRHHLGDLPGDIAPYWYRLRDLNKEANATASETKLDRLKEAALDLSAAINNHAATSDDVKALSDIGIRLSERWELRPLT